MWPQSYSHEQFDPFEVPIDELTWRLIVALVASIIILLPWPSGVIQSL
jgi:hypothetical protein